VSIVGKSTFGGRTLPLVVLFLVSVVGCVSAKKPEVITSPSPIELPREKRLEELPILQLEEKIKKPEPLKTYSLSARDANIRDVLLSFSKESKINIIIDPDISEKVTIDLKDVTLIQAMDALLTPIALEYKLESGFIRVSKPKPITRIFRLNYIITQRRGSRSLSTSSGTGAGGAGGAGGAAAAGGGGAEVAAGAAGAGVGGGATAGTTTQGFTAGFNSITGTDIQDIFREIESSLTAMGLKTPGMLGTTGAAGAGGTAGGGGTAEPPTTKLPPSVKGIFSINRQAGIVLVTAFPDVIAKAAELLEAIEGTIQRQVLIHAKILEVSLKDEFRYGINYDMLFGLLKKGRRDLSLGQGLDEASRTLLPNLVKDIKQVEGFFQFTIRTGDVDAILEALTVQGDVNVISSPKISTLNNQTAIIKVGQQKTFFTVTSTTFATTGTPVTTETVNPSTITIGVTLDVTPQISSDGFITMNIHPSVTDQVGITTSRKGDEAPILDVRETDTVIRVKDGETIVIGGLMQEKIDSEENRVPVLGNIPGLGVLFRQVNNKKKKVDLAIFLTPTILLGERVEDLSTEELQRIRTSEKTKSYGEDK
jgi:MSHA type pilus biogenesis protein MshL